MKTISQTSTNPQDVGLQIFLDDFTPDTCGMPHPRLEFNACMLDEGHIPETHQDAAGNEWIGKEY
jgi:hypothetical protein